MELINFKEIVSIETFDKKRNPYYIWRIGGVIKMPWWCRNIVEKEGFMKIESYIDEFNRDSLRSVKSSVNLDKYIIENITENKIVYKVVYDKPYCKIIMKNKCITTKLFDTYKEANIYAQRIRDKCSKYIKLIDLEK